MSPATDVSTLMSLTYVRFTCPMKHKATLTKSPSPRIAISCNEIIKPALPHNVSGVEHVWYSGLYCVSSIGLHGGNYAVTHKLNELSKVLITLHAGDSVGQTFGSVVRVVLINFYTAECDFGASDELA